MKFQSYEPDSLPCTLISLSLHSGNFAATCFCLYIFLLANVILQVIKRNKSAQIPIFQGPTYIKTYSKQDTVTSQKSKNTFIIYQKSQPVYNFVLEAVQKTFWKHYQILKKKKIL